VNAWHGASPDGTYWGLGRLIRELAEIDDLLRVRYTTSHPLDMDEDLMSAHRDVPQLMPYLHLPIQAGSDRVLKAMNRRHTANDYRQIIDRLREFKPDIALSGDFIVGFPGETDRDFADTIKLVADIGYASAYSFKYSQRPGTPAAGDDLQVDEQSKADRLAALQQLLDAQQMAFNKTCEGQQMSVLIDKTGGRDGQVKGRSPYMQAVYMEGDHAQLGQLATVIVKEARQNSLLVEIEKRPSQIKPEENVA